MIHEPCGAGIWEHNVKEYISRVALIQRNKYIGYYKPCDAKVYGNSKVDMLDV